MLATFVEAVGEPMGETLNTAESKGSIPTGCRSRAQGTGTVTIAGACPLGKGETEVGTFTLVRGESLALCKCG